MVRFVHFYFGIEAKIRKKKISNVSISNFDDDCWPREARQLYIMCFFLLIFQNDLTTNPPIIIIMSLYEISSSFLIFLIKN